MLNLDFDILIMVVGAPCFLTESGSYEDSVEAVLQLPSGADIWYCFDGSNETPQKTETGGIVLKSYTAMKQEKRLHIQ